MELFEIIMIGVGLAMDAFTVSICKGMTFNKKSIKKCLIVALYFGIFQALMPTLGYLLGYSFSHALIKINDYVAFILLSIIGISMIIDSFSDERSVIDDSISFKSMILLSIATSIDAFAVGLTFAFLKTNLLLSVSIIGVITFILCFIGTFIGSVFKSKFGSKCEIIGGVILILTGLKILLEHLNILP